MIMLLIFLDLLIWAVVDHLPHFCGFDSVVENAPGPRNIPHPASSFSHKFSSVKKSHKTTNQTKPPEANVQSNPAADSEIMILTQANTLTFRCGNEAGVSPRWDISKWIDTQCILFHCVDASLGKMNVGDFSSY